MSKRSHVQVIYAPLVEHYRQKCAELQHEVDRLSGMQILRPRQPPHDVDPCCLIEDDEDLVRSHHASSLPSMPSFMHVSSPALCAHDAAPLLLPCPCARPADTPQCFCCLNTCRLQLSLSQPLRCHALRKQRAW